MTYHWIRGVSVHRIYARSQEHALATLVHELCNSEFATITSLTFEPSDVEDVFAIEPAGLRPGELK